MKDSLENFISENRESLDQIEPSDKLWSKIEESIDDKKRPGTNWKLVIRNVAAVVVIFFSSYFVLEYVHYKKNPAGNQFGINNKIPQLTEAEAYYTHQVNYKMAEVGRLLEKHPDLAEELKADFNQIDSLNSDLKSDLQDNVSNQEIVEVLIQNYRIKLEILENLLEQLSVNHEHKNNNNHEL